MDKAEWKARLKQRLKPIYLRGSNGIKQFSNRLTAFLRGRKKPVAVVLGITFFALSTGAFANYYYESNIIPIYHVKVNGEEIGVVNDPAVITAWTEARLKEESAKHKGLTLTLADYITFEEERVYKGKYDNEQALARLADIADFKVEAVKITVDGKVIGYAASQAEADEVFRKIQAKYVDASVVAADKNLTAMAASIGQPPEVPKDGEPVITEVSFKEKVETTKENVVAAKVMSEDKLVELLTKGTLKQQIHTVQPGDCITCIAKQYGITSKDIYANNEGIDENTILQLGQKINVTALKPLVTVQATEEVIQEEVIHYAVQSRNNDQLPKGDTKVIQEGKEGKKRVQYKIIKENGQVVQREALAEEILEEPVPKIIERGTKVIPSRGTGRLQWPASGRITSGYGMRWGKMHKGIDIAGSGSVKAADNGRVVQAGWNGGYGNSVTIDHGNGLRTLYGHLRSINVKVGDVVSKGKTIGVMGSTGNSTGVHLHFEVHKNGVAQNPMNYLGK